MNHVVIIGRLGKDPELRYTASGKAVASVTVATTEKTKEKEHTSWHNVVAWGQTAENLSKYMAKGCVISVMGRIDYRQYTDNSGAKKSITEIVADKIEFLSFPGKGRGDTPEGYPHQDEGTPDHGADYGSDDIPF